MMPAGFQKIRFKVSEISEPEKRTFKFRGLSPQEAGQIGEADQKALAFSSDEAAARYYLGLVFLRDDRPKIRGLSAPDRPEAVPDVRMIESIPIPFTKTHLVKFDQTRESIPVFGSRLNVEMGENRELIHIRGDVADVTGVSPLPSLTPREALLRIAAFAATDQSTLEPKVRAPELRFFFQEKEKVWHLAYFFIKVPAAPEEFFRQADEGAHRTLGKSPLNRHPLINYLVDAHDGQILFYYSATALLDIPARCSGVDETGTSQTFWGRKIPAGFEMIDPLRFIKTYDHLLRDIERDPPPAAAVDNPGGDFQRHHTAAVSAHVNATRVYDFFKSVLIRDGIDDKGMDLISIVNCTYADECAPPVWFNACWYDNRIWYGQSQDSAGNLRSLSRFLDIIAHELTHGVTENTSNLVYRDQSGALNESFSDIFGIIIRNWFEVGPDRPVDGWSWEIGPGLGSQGLPLRDMSDPKRTRDPDHMSKYLHTNNDSGGVHTNSNIHNKAAHNLLTSKDDQNQYVFSPREAAVLYYLCLTRLNSLASFSDALETLLEIAEVYYSGDQSGLAKKIAAIKKAYQDVGIS